MSDIKPARPVGDQLWTDNLGRVRAFAIDTRGARWLWNCGWYIVDEKGEPLRTRAKRPERTVTAWKLVNVSEPRKLGETIRYEPVSYAKQRGDTRQQPLTHAEFRKAVKLLNTKDKKQREVLHGLDRPGRHWRRMTSRETYTHDLFGNVYMLASDGCHAVVETQDGDHEYVCFENLTEYTGVALPPRPSSAAAKETTAKAKRQSNVLALMSKYTAKTKPE